jgi:ABC-type sugar transport system ATPase subunit
MLLTLRGIQKRFGGITALRDGNLEVEAGEVHLLMGENGAGKSTLMKIVAGMLTSDSGEMLWKGSPVRFTKPSEASAMGIAMVHQESLLFPHLTVAENIFLGQSANRHKMMEGAARLIAAHNFPLNAGAHVDSLSPAGKQLVEICRAIQRGTSLLIFDEPTSSLSDTETQEVFKIVRKLTAQGCGVIYITHRLEELRAIGDRVTILRDGATVHCCALADLPREKLVKHMVGRELDSAYRREPVAPGAEMLRVENVRGASLSIRAGEIVGMAGLIGAGRTELCRALFGLDPVESGRVFVEGREVKIRSPRDAVSAGLALIPEDRQRAGLARALPIAHNMTIANLDCVSRFGYLNNAAEMRVAAEQIAKLHIRAGSPAQLAGRLSGGNQQKVVISKWLVRGARVFLFDEPTRGIDVGAKAEVFETMDQLVRNGAAVLMVSSELPELLQVADRILVMRDRVISGELPGRTTQEEIMHLATRH